MPFANAHLTSVLATRKVETLDGKTVDLGGNILPNCAEALQRFVRDRKPRRALEVGFAGAVSAMVIMSTMEANGGEGTLISMDPFQRARSDGVGLVNVRKAGLEHRHKFYEDFDYLVLPRLLAEKTRLDFGYIDGWHTFDYTLLDFFYVDKMLDKGGVVAFNDCGLKAVRKAIDYVLTHRRYREIDVGIEQDYGHGPGSLVRWIQGHSHADRYFEKVDEWEPDWDFFANF